MRNLSICAFCVCCIAALQGCGDANIDMVKKSNFPGYNTITVGDLLDSRFDSPRWSTKKNDRGETIVLFEGKITSKMHDAVKSKIWPLYEFPANADVGGYKHIFNGARLIIGNYGKNNVDQEFVNKFEECGQYYMDAPNSGYINTLQERLREAQARLAESEEDPEGARYVLDMQREKVFEIEHELAEIEEKLSPQWQTAKQECARVLLESSHQTYDPRVWRVGDSLFFEWAVHSSGHSFELASFGAATLPSITLSNALEVIYNN